MPPDKPQVDNPDLKIVMGCTVQDKITGFKGRVTGQAEYITGCTQYLIQPSCKDGEWVNSHWFDKDRLEVNSTSVLTIEQSEKPGADKPAPIK